MRFPLLLRSHTRYRTKVHVSTRRLVSLFGWAALALASPALAQTWMADNGNGTYTNPLFFDEFSDPDMIRVGSDFYLTGTTILMSALGGWAVGHAMPPLRRPFRASHLRATKSTARPGGPACIRR